MSGSQLQSWARWLASRATGHPTAFTPEQLRDLIAARPGRARQRPMPQLTRWEAFRAQFRSSWEPDHSDRRLHVFAAIASVLINLFFGAMLLWLMYLRFMAPSMEMEDVAIQVQMIGQGAPAEEGGGTPADQPEITTAQQGAQAESSAHSASSTPESASLSQRTAQVSSESIAMQAPSMPELQVTDMPPTPAPPVPTPPTPVPPTPPVAVEVSKPTPTISSFQIPPPQPIQLPPDLATQRPELQAQSIPTPPVPVPPTTTPPIPAPAPAEVPVPRIATRAVAMPQLPQSQPTRSTDLSQAVRALPDLPAPTPAPPPGSSTWSTNAAATPAPAGAKAAGTASTSSPLKGSAATTGAPKGMQGAGTGVQPLGQGIGTSTQARTGGAQTTLKSDDWGASSRNALGQPKGAASGSRTGSASGASGLYNADGSLRVDDRFVANVRNPYKEGTWIRRPSKFEPTRFEVYWKPNETLLAEILRAGQKFVRMPPQPGQSAQMICELMTGKGMAPMFNCFGAPVNPKQEQPAVARPPPEVPFKNNYFEDQSALGSPQPAAPLPAPLPEPASPPTKPH